MFALVTSSVSAVRLLLQGALSTFAEDLDKVRLRVAEVQTDCVWFTSGQNQLIQVLQDEVMTAGIVYADNVEKTLQTSLRDLMATIPLEKIEYEKDEGIAATIESYNNERNQTCLELIPQCGDLIREKFTKFNDSLTDTLNAEIISAIDRIEMTTAVLTWRLRKSNMDPILSYSRETCPECLNYRDTILEGLTAQVLQYLREDATSELLSMQEDLKSASWEIHLDALSSCNFQDSDNFLADLESLKTQLDEHARKVHINLVEPVVKTVRFAEELMRLTTSKCGSELQRPLEGYMDSHTRMEIVFDAMVNRVITFEDTFKTNSKSYEDIHISLAEMAKQTDIAALTDDLETSLVTLQGLLDQRKISLMRIGQYINVINYWFLAQTLPGTLRSNSKYWRSLNLRNPRLSNPSRDNPELVAKTEEYVISDQTVNNYWDGLSAKLNNYRRRTEEAVMNFHRDISPARNYLEAYLNGNVLEESFLG